MASDTIEASEKKEIVMGMLLRIAAVVGVLNLISQHSESVIAWGPYYVFLGIFALTALVMVGLTLKAAGQWAWGWNRKADAYHLRSTVEFGVALIGGMVVVVAMAWGWGKFYENRSAVVYAVSPTVGHWLGVKEPVVPGSLLAKKK